MRFSSSGYLLIVLKFDPNEAGVQADAIPDANHVQNMDR